MEEIKDYINLIENDDLNVEIARKFQFALICLSFLTLGAQRRQVVANFAIDVSIIIFYYL
jgi:hypothetical protein